MFKSESFWLPVTESSFKWGKDYKDPRMAPKTRDCTTRSGECQDSPRTGAGVGPGAGSLLPAQLTLSTLYCCPLRAQRHASFPQTLHVAEARATGSCGVRT